MNIEITKEDKHDTEIKIDNVTIAELLRAYLSENGASFAAWRREHPSKSALFKINATEGTVAKAVNNTVAAIKKDTAKLAGLIKKQ